MNQSSEPHPLGHKSRKCTWHTDSQYLNSGSFTVLGTITFDNCIHLMWPLSKQAAYKQATRGPMALRSL